jgi:hypothetical protein
VGRAWRGLAAVSMLAAIMLVAGPHRVLAECDGPYPSFRNVAPGAERILIGEVVQVDPAGERHDDGRTAGFVLHGQSVLEGGRAVDEVFQDVPTQQCAGMIVARVGDVIAVAFRGRDFEPPQVVNAVAWIEGDAPELIGVERISVPEIYQLAGVPMPVPSARVADVVFPASKALALTAAVAALAAAILIVRRRMLRA